MKKISLSVAAILFACASVFASGHAPAKKIKHATCHTCSKAKCTSKVKCPDTGNCSCD